MSVFSPDDPPLEPALVRVEEVLAEWDPPPGDGLDGGAKAGQPLKGEHVRGGGVAGTHREGLLSVVSYTILNQYLF